MKNSLIKFYTIAFYFSATFMMMAQGPSDDADNGGIDDDGTGDLTPMAPIDDYVWVLTLIALTFAFLKFRAVYLQMNRSQD